LVWEKVAVEANVAKETERFWAIKDRC
jgi:hypothetical protein